MTDNCDQHLEALVELSSTHSKSELILKFISSLKKELPGNTIILYEILLQRESNLKTNIPVARDFLSLESEIIKLTDDDILKESYEKKQPFFNNEDTYRVYPIINIEKVEYLIAVKGYKLNPIKSIITENMITLFNNQISLINARDHDHLTGLLNREAFSRLIPAIYSGEGMANFSYIGLIDIDHFKNVNDMLGHIIGDEILLLISQHLKSKFRPDDIIVRYGGEEFLILLKEADIEDAYTIFERFRNFVANYSFPQIEKVTVSIGYSRFNIKEGLSIQIEKADRALYFAKESGRNRTCSYEVLTVDKKVSQVSDRTGDIIIFD